MPMKKRIWSVQNNKLFAVVLVVAMVLGLFSGCSFRKLSGKEAFCEGWYSIIEKPEMSAYSADFSAGWDAVKQFAINLYSATTANDYVRSVGNAIQKLEDGINKSAKSARDTAREAGFAAEEWAAGTFNINAAANGSDISAEVVGSNATGSPDIILSDGTEAQSKFYKNARGSIGEASVTFLKKYIKYCNKTKDKAVLSFKEYYEKYGYEVADKVIGQELKPLYKDMQRIIPEDQMDNAVKFLKGKIKKLEVKGQNAEALKTTLDNLKDRLKASDGTESKPITLEEMKAITELGKEGKFIAEDFGITLSSAVSIKYILKQAIQNAAKVGAIATAITLGPELYNLASQAIKNKELKAADIVSFGLEGSKDLAETTFGGASTSLLYTTCSSGKLGKSIQQSASPMLIAALVVVMMDAVRYGYALSKGEITADDFGNLVAQSVVTVAAGTGMAGVLSQFLGATPVVYIAGSMVGAIIGSAGYDLAKKAVLEMVDGNGFEVLVIKNTVKRRLSVITEKITALDFKSKATDLKNMVVSTFGDGTIEVSKA